MEDQFAVSLGEVPPLEMAPNRPSKRTSPMPRDSNKRRRLYDSNVIEGLVQQVSQIQNFLQNLPYLNEPAGNCHSYDDHENVEQDDDAMSLNVSGELFQDMVDPIAPMNDPNQFSRNTQETGYLPSQLDVNQAGNVPPRPDFPQASTSQLQLDSSQPGFSLNVNTTLKEPSILKTENARLERLKYVQHFESPDWADVRYSEAQKRFCSTPGFTNLECNDEIKSYDKYNYLALTERGFAAITQGLIKQQESVESGFQNLLTWIRSLEVIEISSLENKIKEIFSEHYEKISNDLLQMTCGHRADLIQQRRDAILRSVKDKFIKANIRKIPPSCEYLFSPKDFTSTIDKNGGMSKVFWPLKNQLNKSALSSANQAKSTKQPAQGYEYVPNTAGPSFIRPMAPAHGMPLYPFTYPPAQGGLPFYNQPMPSAFNRAPSQGQKFRPTGQKPNEDNSSRQSKAPSRRGRTKRRY